MKRLFAITGIIASIAMLALLTGSVEFYSNNENCSKCHEMKRYTDTWRTSIHGSIGCEACHRRHESEGMISLKGTAIQRIAQHFLKKDKKPKAYIVKENCYACHPSIKKEITASRNSRIINPHPVHLAAGFVCIDCHKDFVHTKRMVAKPLPEMETCIRCHKEEDISVECSTCHFGSQEHISRIAKSGGYTLQAGQSCEVCHTNKAGSKTEHKKALQNVGGFKGTATCLKCHVDAAESVVAGVHSKLRTPVTNAEGVNVTKGMADIAANPAMWAWTAEKKDRTVKSGGCGRCHAGGSNLPNQEMVSTIDCLICHARDYDLRQRKVVGDGGVKKWIGDTSVRAANSVGKPVASYCWRCHEERMAMRRGTPYEAEHDVHAEAGMACQSCHVTIRHKIARGAVADISANDIPEVSVQCESCHVDYNHEARNIDLHQGRLACQACHVGRVEGMIAWDRVRGVDEDGDGLFEEEFILKKGVTPTFMWFNGRVDGNNLPLGNKADRKARLYPFKVYSSISAIDSRTKKPVPSSAATFAKTGDFDLAVRAAAKSMHLPKPPKWIKVEATAIKQLNHAIKRKGLECNDCHAKDGIMDFKKLGYSQETIKRLTAPQSYSK